MDEADLVEVSDGLQRLPGYLGGRAARELSPLEVLSPDVVQRRADQCHHDELELILDHPLVEQVSEVPPVGLLGLLQLFQHHDFQLQPVCPQVRVNGLRLHRVALALVGPCHLVDVAVAAGTEHLGHLPVDLAADHVFAVDQLLPFLPRSP